MMGARLAAILLVGQSGLASPARAESGPEDVVVLDEQLAEDWRVEEGEGWRPSS